MTGAHHLGVVLGCIALAGCSSAGGGGGGSGADGGDGGGEASVDGNGGTLDGGADGQGASDSSMIHEGSSGGEAATEAGHTDSGATWWQPGTGALPWQWELDHEIVTTSASDMGTGDTTYTGSAAAAPLVYDIDGFDNTAGDVAALHALGKKVICYVEVGAAESNRPDYAQFPTADLGTVVPSYPSEKYLNILDPAVTTIIEARISMCAQKGFDGIEPDIDDSYTDSTGFTITQASNVAYLANLSAYAHSLGVAWGLKNGGDGGDPATFVPQMLPYVDFAVVEEPFFLTTISFFEPTFSGAGKAMFVAEYTSDTASSTTFCPGAISDKTNAALFDVALDGVVRNPCQ